MIKTRDGVAQAVRKPLVHHEDVWQIIKGQLERLKITPDKNNARQALFPQTATVLDNPTGTAPGFFFLVMTAPLLFCLVPSQALALLEDYLQQNEKKYSSQSRATYAWTLIGIDESTLAHWVDHHFATNP